MIAGGQIAGCYDEALSWIHRDGKQNGRKDRAWPRLLLHLAGRSKEAQQAIARAREMDRNWCLSRVRKVALSADRRSRQVRRSPAKSGSAGVINDKRLYRPRGSVVRFWLRMSPHEPNRTLIRGTVQGDLKVIGVLRLANSQSRD